MFKQYVKLQCLRWAVTAGVPAEQVEKLAKDLYKWVSE